MIIKKITLKNFYRYGPQEQSLDLTGSGIVGVIGNNGYGKSTLLIDSLLFAFYGKYRCNTIDEVVNMYTEKDCKIGVELEEQGVNYKIIRYRKHTTHNNNVYIFKEDKDISGHTVAETNNLIIDIIKMPYIAFTNSCVFSSELYSEFLAGQNADRLKIFENILSLKEVNSFYETSKDILKELNNNLEEEKTKKTSISSEINTINITIQNYSNNAKEKLIAAKKQKDLAKKTIKDAEEKIKEYSEINISDEKNKLSNNSLKEEYKEKISNLENSKKSFIVNEPVEELIIIDKYKNINFEENKIIELKYLEDVETMKTRQNGFNLEQEKIKSLTSEISNITSTINFNLNTIKELDEKILKLKEATCPFCGNHLTSEKVEEELNKSNLKLNELTEHNKELNKQKENLNKDLDVANENYTYLIGDYNRIKNSLNNNFVPNSDLVETQYKNALKRVDECKKLKISNDLKINEIDKEIEKINEKLNSLQTTIYTEEELNNIEEKINILNSLISEKQLEVAAIDGSVKSLYDKKYIEELNKNVEDKNKELDKIVSKIKEQENIIKHYEYLKDCFSNKSNGFKKYFIGNMIGLFNEKINQYLPFFFSENVKIEFDKDLNETIEMDGFKIGFKSFSQGQRQRAELAISFSLFDVARAFFKNDNKLLILDELDKGLDKSGIQAMMNILRGFDKQLKIFIVSHNPLLEDEIDEKIKIERDINGFSKIKVK